MLKQPEPFFFERGEQVVILLHAYSGSANDVRMLARALERRNYSVYAPQFSGHATNDPRDIVQEGSPEKWCQDTKRAISFVRQKGYTKISIFGLSLGGLFATLALAQDPQLLGGGIFSSPVLPQAETRVAAMFIQRSQALLARQGLTAAQQAPILAALKPAVAAQLTAVNQFTTTVIQPQLAQLTQPYFIAQGGQDELIDATGAQRLRDQLQAQGLVVDYHWYPTAGHVVTVNSAHHQLEQAVLTYLKTIYN